MQSSKAIRLETWRPAGEWTPPRCTRVFVGDFELSNCLECAGFQKYRLYPSVCDECWSGHCGGRVADVVRAGEYVMLMPPHLPDDDEDVGYSPLAQPTCLAHADWEMLREICKALPEFSQVRTPLGEQLKRWWLTGLPRELDPWRSDSRLVAEIRNATIAADPLDDEPAIQAIHSIYDFFDRNLKRAIPGRLVEASLEGLAVTTLFFDFKGTPEWRGLAQTPDGVVPMVSVDWAFVPDDGIQPLGLG